jgi:tetratricopeptide (TPR) repeat protein
VSDPAWKTAPRPRVLRKANKTFPNNADILRHLETVHHTLRDFESAEESFQQLLKILPPGEKSQRAAARTALGKSLWQQQKREDALDAWRHALELVVLLRSRPTRTRGLKPGEKQVVDPSLTKPGETAPASLGCGT